MSAFESFSQDPFNKIVNFQDHDEGGIAVGYFSPNSVRVYEPDGTERWRAPGPQEIWEVARDRDGNVFAVGHALPIYENPTIANNPSQLWGYAADNGALLFKVDIVPTYGGNVTVAGGLACDPDGNIFMSFHDVDNTHPVGDPGDGAWAIRKYNPFGGIITEIRLGTGQYQNPFFDWGYFCDSAGNLLGSRGQGAQIFKRNSSLGLVWEHNITGDFSGTDEARTGAIPIVDRANNIYYESNGALYKLSPNGSVVWSVGTGEHPDQAYCQLGTDGDNIYAIGGGSFAPMKVDSDGIVLWSSGCPEIITWSAGAHYCAASAGLYKFDAETGELEWSVFNDEYVFRFRQEGPYTIAQIPIFGEPPKP